MKIIITIFAILAYASSYACSCRRLPSINDSYIAARVIFYGKYVSTDTIEEFRDFSGSPYVISNFEVVKFYKGIDSSTFQHRLKLHDSYIVSVVVGCNDPCGICFEKGKMYLVYGYIDLFYGNLSTNQCLRTREVESENFVSSHALDSDFRKNEDLVLDSLYHNEKLMFRDAHRYEDVRWFEKKQLIMQIEGKEKIIGKLSMAVYFLVAGIFLIIGVAYIGMRKIKKVR